jgi:hypothetical protein
MLTKIAGWLSAHRAQPFERKPWWVTLASALGALFGIAGTAVLARAPAQVPTVFVCYLFSNLAWICVALRTRQLWLLAMNLVYLSLACVGLYKLVL